MEKSAELLKSGLLVSNAERASLADGEWNVTLHLRIDPQTGEGQDLKLLLEKSGVWFDG